MGRAAVILKPRALLKSNRTYRLDLGKLSGSDVVNGSDPGWTTGKAPDQKGPKWLERPNVRFLLPSDDVVATPVKTDKLDKKGKPVIDFQNPRDSADMNCRWLTIRSRSALGVARVLT